MNQRSYSGQPGGEQSWLAGDFHTHSTASDGDYPLPVLAGIARAEGLDFICITDHNSISAYKDINALGGFPVIPGIEVTFRRGHFNIFGLPDWFDWMDEICIGEIATTLPDQYTSINQLLRKIRSQDLLISINHPLLDPWAWQFPQTDLRLVHAVELWNDLYWPGNKMASPATMEMWTKWLNAGLRITAIGGSDYHYPPRPEENKYGERLGMPTTYVRVKDSHPDSICNAIKRHRAVVTRGPRVDFTAENASETFQVGDDLANRAGKITFHASIKYRPKPIEVHLVRNGEVIARSKQKQSQVDIEFQDELVPQQPRWYRLDILDDSGEALAITNPIFAGTPANPTAFLFRDYH